MTRKDYNINTKVNGNFTNIFVNFTDGTYAKVTLRSFQTRKGIRYSQVGRTTGTYNAKKWAISGDEIYGTVQVRELSEKKADVSEKLVHENFGEVEVLGSENGQLLIRLADGTEKKVLESIFMNNIK